MKAICALGHVSAGPSSCALNKLPERVLLLLVGGLGEAVMAGSVTQHLIRRHPQIEIDVVATPAAADTIMRYVPGRLYALPTGTDGTFGVRSFVSTLLAVCRHRYRAAVDLSYEWLSTPILARAAAIPTRIGFAPLCENPRTFLMTHAVKLNESHSAWEMYIRLFQMIDPGLPELLPLLPVIYTRSEERGTLEWLRGRVGNPSGRIIAFHMGTGNARRYRRWPVDRFGSLAKELQDAVGPSTIVLTGTRDDRAAIDEFRSRYSGGTIDASGLSSVGWTACLLRHCDLLVSVETGVMHLGAAMGTPTVGLLGPNDPRIWGPIGPRATYVYKPTVSCSPCIYSYRNQSPVECTHSEKSRCMLDIEPEDVVQAARRVMVS